MLFARLWFIKFIQLEIELTLKKIFLEIKKYIFKMISSILKFITIPIYV